MGGDADLQISKPPASGQVFPADARGPLDSKSGQIRDFAMRPGAGDQISRPRQAGAYDILGNFLEHAHECNHFCNP